MTQLSDEHTGHTDTGDTETMLRQVMDRVSYNSRHLALITGKNYLHCNT